MHCRGAAAGDPGSLRRSRKLPAPRPGRGRGPHERTRRGRGTGNCSRFGTDSPGPGAPGGTERPYRIWACQAPGPAPGPRGPARRPTPGRAAAFNSA
eukprot:757123-Hanusia_phi.AAC.1